MSSIKNLSLLVCGLTILVGCTNYFTQDVQKTPITTQASHSKEAIIPEIATGRTFKPSVTAKKFMVVAANPLAVQAGKDILAKGGSAIDAAIAVQAMLNVVEPQSSGIGGGGFLVSYDKKHGKILSYDGRETAPHATKPTHFLKKDGSEMDFETAATGGGAVAVPGLLKMLKSAHDAGGKLPWKDLFEPAIKTAREGFPLSSRLRDMLKFIPYYEKLSPEDIARYKHKNGTLKNVNEVVTNKALAHTFEKIANDGINDFYEGKIAKDIVGTVQNSPAFPAQMTIAELKNYKSPVRNVPCVTYHVYKVCGMSPPSSGGVTVLQSLKMLEEFNLQNYKPYSPESVHLIASAMRLAYADRNKYLADPDFVSVPTEKLLDEHYLKSRATLIDKNHAFKMAVAGDPSVIQTTQYASLKTTEPPSTTHVSIIDAQGNAVSMTNTIERAFGSGLVTKSGFILNNQMTDFDFSPQKDGLPVANSVQAGKRPRSSMAPFIVFDKKGDVKLVIGSPGGARIIAFVLPKIISVLDWDMPLDKALDAPNIVAMYPEARIELEKDVDLKDLEHSLRSKGYKLDIIDLTSGIHAIERDKGLLIGAADPRREGVALGE